MKTTLLTLLLILGLGSVSIGQRANTQAVDGKVELMIVRGDVGCTDCESFIYERSGNKLKKIAFLYPKESTPKSWNNAYNASMIQEVLTEYSLEGYEIYNTYKTDDAMQKSSTIVYELGRAEDAWVNANL